MLHLYIFFDSTLPFCGLCVVQESELSAFHGLGKHTPRNTSLAQLTFFSLSVSVRVCDPLLSSPLLWTNIALHMFKSHTF